MEKRILIADDEGINRLFVKTILMSKGWSVVEAADGKQAIELAAQQDFDLILLDIKMPVLDGWEAGKKIRALEREKDGSKRIPILGFTAYLEEDLMEELKESGIDGIVKKPITEEILLRKISSYLDQEE